MITLTDYLLTRQSCVNHNIVTITKIEAKAFKMQFPPRAGWLKKFANYKIDDETANQLRFIVDKQTQEKKNKASKQQDKFNLKLKENVKKQERTKKRYIAEVIPLVTKTKYKHHNLGKDTYNKFYSTKEWRQLRYLALKNCNYCQCCGARPGPDVILHVDHIKPRSRYPELELSLSNVQILCESCNLGKGDWDETSYKQHFNSI